MAAGTEIPLTLRALVAGWSYTAGCGGTGCCGYVWVTVRAGLDSATTTFSGHTFSGRADFDGAVEVPMTLVAGTPRVVEVEMYARRCSGGSHTVDATVRLVFEGAHEEAQVFSCKGYGPNSVPITPSSWGALKAIYR